jgi:hypothetical protein
MACLEAAGIDYDYAKARRAPEVDLEDPRWDWLREELFPNPILRVRPDDGPATWAVMAGRDQDYGVIPARLYGSPVFLVDDDSGTIDYLPLAPIDDEIRMRSEIDITPVGYGFEATVRVRLPATASAFWKESLRDMTGQQKRTVGVNMARMYVPGTRVEEVSFEGIDEPGAPVFIVARAKVESTTTQTGQNLMALRLGFPLLNLVGRFATPGERDQPFLFEDHDYRTDVMRIHLGADYRAVTVPQEWTVDRFLGKYRLDVRYLRDGLEIEIERDISFHPTRIEAERYPEFMTVCRKIDDLEGERIWILPLFEPDGSKKKGGDAEAPPEREKDGK